MTMMMMMMIDDDDDENVTDNHIDSLQQLNSVML